MPHEARFAGRQGGARALLARPARPRPSEIGMTVKVCTATDLGLKRSQNEDCLGFWFADDAAGLARRGVLLVVADGMGGSRAGEVASRLAVDTVLRCYRDGNAEQPIDDLSQAIENANRVVHGQSTANPELRGMGTTCTALVVRGSHAFVAHVGDSRAYAIHDGAIHQITRDHSLVAQLVENRQITPEQARIDPRRNLVTRSVGVALDVDVDAETLHDELREGDTLVLCTDGLHGLVNDDEIANAASGQDLEGACRSLVELARQRGGPDNITLMIARLVPGDRPTISSVSGPAATLDPERG
jgi:serine/threonine protein phosphatase PrpC